MPQYPLYASQIGLEILPEPASASYCVHWGITVMLVGQKMTLFDSERVVVDVV